MIYLRPKSLLIPKRGFEMPKTEVQGWFKLEATRPDGTKRVLADWFPNLILDQGLNRMGTASFMTHCQVGTGNGTPLVSDASLQARVAGAAAFADVTGNSGGSPYYGKLTRQYRFAVGAAAGNLAEVGTGWSPTASASLFSRALILDGGGTPTTITVLGDEVLDVFYELRTYAPLVDSTFNVTISAVNYTITSRAARATQWTTNDAVVTNQSQPNFAQNVFNGTLGAITSSPSGTGATNSGLTNNAYSNNSLQQDSNMSYDLTHGNVAGGISAMLIVHNLGSSVTIGGHQLSFSPAIAKDATKVLSLDFRISWARKTLP